MSRVTTLLAAVVTAALIMIAAVATTRAQVSYANPSPVLVATQYALVPIAATAGSATQTTLTIPAPPPTFYNYVCSLHLNYSQTAATGTALTNAVTSTTNFNTLAWKLSTPAAVNTNIDVFEGWGIANVGCVKSTSPGVATTFVSPAGATNGQFTWTASYYQAP